MTYVEEVYAKLEKENPNEKEFLQAAKEILFSCNPFSISTPNIKRRLFWKGSLNPNVSSCSEYLG